MISPVRFEIPVSVTRRRIAVIGLFSLLALLASACSVQETNTYPVDTFTEMHYSQSYRMQEPPRLQPPAESVAFDPLGDPVSSLTIPAAQRRTYNPEVAAELFRVNCSACHGINGEGNGPAAAHLQASDSFYFSKNGSKYGPPANLLATRDQRTEEIWFGTLNNGIVVMPAFENLLSEEEIWDIVTYLFDKQNGLGS
jgi:mono/diheme cytochrome c family protein